ncbi:hypothetical protein E2C01_018100 [Portunus trituberculatus]|uniref:Uncharacterized protein n=1 Tax=Portunus trituberculatus TaxID=210409 RepID=A0A5B7DVJ1_PORTR|nr:hypothetical protein [Portunus trituberculatus]
MVTPTQVMNVNTWAREDMVGRSCVAWATPVPQWPLKHQTAIHRPSYNTAITLSHWGLVLKTPGPITWLHLQMYGMVGGVFRVSFGTVRVEHKLHGPTCDRCLTGSRQGLHRGILPTAAAACESVACRAPPPGSLVRSGAPESLEADPPPSGWLAPAKPAHQTRFCKF